MDVQSQFAEDVQSQITQSPPPEQLIFGRVRDDKSMTYKTNTARQQHSPATASVAITVNKQVVVHVDTMISCSMVSTHLLIVIAPSTRCDCVCTYPMPSAGCTSCAPFERRTPSGRRRSGFSSWVRGYPRSRAIRSQPVFRCSLSHEAACPNPHLVVVKHPTVR